MEMGDSRFQSRENAKGIANRKSAIPNEFNPGDDRLSPPSADGQDHACSGRYSRGISRLRPRASFSMTKFPLSSERSC